MLNPGLGAHPGCSNVPLPPAPQAPHRVLLLSFPLAEVGRFKGPCKMSYQGIKSYWHWLLSPQLTLILPVNSRVSLMGEADAVSPSFPGKNAII